MLPISLDSALLGLLFGALGTLGTIHHLRKRTARHAATACSAPASEQSLLAISRLALLAEGVQIADMSTVLGRLTQAEADGLSAGLRVFLPSAKLGGSGPGSLEEHLARIGKADLPDQVRAQLVATLVRAIADVELCSMAAGCDTQGQPLASWKAMPEELETLKTLAGWTAQWWQTRVALLTSGLSGVNGPFVCSRWCDLDGMRR